MNLYLACGFRCSRTIYSHGTSPTMDQIHVSGPWSLIFGFRMNYFLFSFEMRTVFYIERFYLLYLFYLLYQWYCDILNFWYYLFVYVLCFLFVVVGGGFFFLLLLLVSWLLLCVPQSLISVLVSVVSTACCELTLFCFLTEFLRRCFLILDYFVLDK